MRKTLALVLLGGLAGCQPAAPSPEPAVPDPTVPAEEAEPTEALTGRVWVATDSSAAPGRIHVFLPDLVVSTSCVETYRLDPWRGGGDGRLVITEDAAEVPVEWSVEGDALTLTRTLVGGTTTVERYRAASEAALCPDLR